METMTINGRGSGVVVDSFYQHEVGEEIEVDGVKYTIMGKECLSKVADGNYNRPTLLILRGFTTSKGV